MKVVEKFVSINGEGTHAGELAVFIRFKGCNLNCGYCDTTWANEPACPYEEETPEAIMQYIKDTGVKNVTLTGGEPLLQKEMKHLLALLLADDYLRVEIETNGAVDLKEFCEVKAGSDGQYMRPYFTMDYKLPSSGCEDRMLTDNFSYLEKEDTVKFVSGSMKDLDRMQEIVRTYGLDQKCHVYISPVFGAIECTDIVDYMIGSNLVNVRLQIQMHKVIWDPDKRGV